MFRLKSILRAMLLAVLIGPTLVVPTAFAHGHDEEDAHHDGPGDCLVCVVLAQATGVVTETPASVRLALAPTPERLPLLAQSGPLARDLETRSQRGPPR